MMKAAWPICCAMSVLVLPLVYGIMYPLPPGAMNLSTGNAWILPKNNFPVFYRHFRDRISWIEADAVCQFHHGQLATADTNEQYVAVNAYLKDLDVTDLVWIGLKRTGQKGPFLWNGKEKLMAPDKLWHGKIPKSDNSLCVVTDPAVNFKWRAFECNGPAAATFVCELDVPDWAKKDGICDVSSMRLTKTIFLPMQSAIQLSVDCGPEGTKTVVCDELSDHHKIISALECSNNGSIYVNQKENFNSTITITINEINNELTTNGSAAIENETSSSYEFNTIPLNDVEVNTTTADSTSSVTDSYSTNAEETNEVSLSSTAILPEEMSVAEEPIIKSSVQIITDEQKDNAEIRNVTTLTSAKVQDFAVNSNNTVNTITTPRKSRSNSTSSTASTSTLTTLTAATAATVGNIKKIESKTRISSSTTTATATNTPAPLRITTNSVNGMIIISNLSASRSTISEINVTAGTLTNDNLPNSATIEPPPNDTGTPLARKQTISLESAMLSSNENNDRGDRPVDTDTVKRQINLTAVEEEEVTNEEWTGGKSDSGDLTTKPYILFSNQKINVTGYLYSDDQQPEPSALPQESHELFNTAGGKIAPNGATAVTVAEETGSSPAATVKQTVNPKQLSQQNRIDRGNSEQSNRTVSLESTLSAPVQQMGQVKPISVYKKIEIKPSEGGNQHATKVSSDTTLGLTAATLPPLERNTTVHVTSTTKRFVIKSIVTTANEDENSASKTTSKTPSSLTTTSSAVTGSVANTTVAEAAASTNGTGSPSTTDLSSTVAPNAKDDAGTLSEEAVDEEMESASINNSPLLSGNLDENGLRKPNRKRHTKNPQHSSYPYFLGRILG